MLEGYLNAFAVGTNGKGEILIGLLPARPLSKEQAINLAAWLGVIADPVGDHFQKAVKAVRST